MAKPILIIIKFLTAIIKIFFKSRPRQLQFRVFSAFFEFLLTRVSVIAKINTLIAPLENFKRKK